MSLLDRIFSEPELRDDPPVLVDVGAAGGVWPLWRAIAGYSVGVGFEPDGRDAGALSSGKGFRRWAYVEGLVAPSAVPGEKKPFHLTRAPHCSSLLRPRTDALAAWQFAELFTPEREAMVPAVTLAGALKSHGIDRVDWLKCDTQGLDLSIYLSLPAEWRTRLLAVDFEPGLIDAYEGEDKLWRTLQAMESEPFWVCELQAGFAIRGGAAGLNQALGPAWTRLVPRLAPTAPVFANVRYLRDLGKAEPLDRRGLLLAWVFADLLGQHTHAIEVAAEGTRRFPGGLFADLERASVSRLRRAMLGKLAGKLWRRLTGTR